MITYQNSVDGVEADQLAGFFVGWPKPPSQEKHLRILKGSQHVVLARDEETGQVIGFITAISDGVLSAYIPLLEVLPEHQKSGIGGELVRRLLAELRQMYMIDLLCDEDLQPYYERLGMRRAQGMFVRNYDRVAEE